MKTLSLSTLLLAGFAGFTVAQDAKAPAPAAAPAPAETPAAPALTPEQQAIADQANAYMAAYNKGDAKAIAGMFADDAEWVDAEGGTFSGREAIGTMLESALKGGSGQSLDISVLSVRPLTADVLVEKGLATITGKDGHNAVSSYTAVHVRKDGKWKISQFTETGAPLEGNAALQLSSLEWLVGTWADQTDGIEARATVEWAANHTFLTRSFSYKREGTAEAKGTEVIGWDPTAGKIRSWTFQSDGGFSENVWTQDGTRWLIQHRTVLPDGGQGVAQQTMTQVDKDKFTWSSSGRSLDGELLPNIDPVTVVRVK